MAVVRVCVRVGGRVGEGWVAVWYDKICSSEHAIAGIVGRWKTPTRDCIDYPSSRMHVLNAQNKTRCADVNLRL